MQISKSLSYQIWTVVEKLFMEYMQKPIMALDKSGFITDKYDWKSYLPIKPPVLNFKETWPTV